MKQSAQSPPRGVGHSSASEDERRAMIRSQGTPAQKIAQIARDARARINNGGKSPGSPSEQPRVPGGQPGGGEFAGK
jgi:hypothetical protein